MNALFEAIRPDLLQEGQSSNLSGDPQRSPNENIDFRTGAQASAKRQRSGRPLGLLQHSCSICDKSYERLDHLNRHLRSHENARPFQCGECLKRFNRGDLLRRHKTTHGPDSVPNYRHASADRTVQACQACATAKSKCEDQKPCRRCREKNITCEYSNLRRQSQEVSETSLVHANASTAIRLQDGQPLQQSQNHFQSFTTPRTNEDSTLNGSDNGGQELNNGVSSMLPEDHQVFEQPNTPFATIPDHGEFGTTDDFSFVFDFQDCMPFPLEVSNFGQDIDFSVSEFDWNTSSYIRNLLIPVIQKETGQVLNESGTASLRHEAFKRSPWLWIPTNKDHQLAEQESLVVTNSSIILSPELDVSADSRVIDEQLDQDARDGVYALVLTILGSTKNIRSFPTAESLDKLMQMFFIKERLQTDTWIHAASFRPTKARSELVAAIIAQGSTFIASPEVSKMGLALQEVVRASLTTLFESNNSITRDLQALQAFMLWVDIGLWSGYRRKMELAESFEQPLLTMLRRSGIFSLSRYSQDIVPQPDDADDVLESKWLEWVEQESFKRLAIHIYMHDMQTSMAFLTNPLISYTEMTFPLPASRDLWFANSAAEWRNTYLRKSIPIASQTPSFMDGIHDVTLFELAQDLIDSQMCSHARLYSQWAQISTYRESSKLSSCNPQPGWNATSQLLVTSQQYELYRNVQVVYDKLRQMTKQPAEVLLVTELLKMSLNVSIEELQRFAGKAGEKDARRTYPILRDWIETADARYAAWHAGQVLRAAKLFPQTQLRGFFSIAVYHASLTLWVYGLAARALRYRGVTGSSTPVVRPATLDVVELAHVSVLLDGDETRETRAFLRLGHGDPGLTYLRVDNLLDDQFERDSFISLENSRTLMDIARRILWINYPIETEALPSLVENIGNLMRDLGDLASVPNLRRASSNSNGV